MNRLSAVRVDRRMLKIDPFRERNSVLFQGNEKYKNPILGVFVLGNTLILMLTNLLAGKCRGCVSNGYP